MGLAVSGGRTRGRSGSSSEDPMAPECLAYVLGLSVAITKTEIVQHRAWAGPGRGKLGHSTGNVGVRVPATWGAGLPKAWRDSSRPSDSRG